MQRIRGLHLLARPGVPDKYTINAAAGLLRISKYRLRVLLKEHGFDCWRTGMRIPRSDLVRLAQSQMADRPIALARMLNSIDNGRVVAMTSCPKLRHNLSRWEPLYAATPFLLGGMLCVVPCRAVLIDCESCGSTAAYAIAGEIRKYPDRPKLIAVLPEDVEASCWTPWDHVLHRQTDWRDLKQCLD